MARDKAKQKIYARNWYLKTHPNAKTIHRAVQKYDTEEERQLATKAWNKRCYRKKFPIIQPKLKHPTHYTDSEKKENSRLFYEYGITLAQFYDMLEEQNKKCKICKRTEYDGKMAKLCVDHCHTTKKVRGLLCRACNAALGKFEQCPELLLVAYKYLTEEPNHVWA